MSLISACCAFGQNTFDPDDVVNLKFTIGDGSGSHSERWLMNVAGGPKTFHAQSPDYGQIGTSSSTWFRKGNTYSITVDHQGTSPEYKGKPFPDFDYTAKVETLSSVGYLIVDEAQPALLGTSNAGETNEASGKTAYIAFPKPVLSFTDYTEEETEGDPGVLVLVNDNDSNEDGEIDHDSPYPGDPDYVEIFLKLELSGAVNIDEGIVRLSASNMTALRVWDPDNGFTSLVLPIEWDMSTNEGDPFRGAGKQLFLEALEASQAYKDVTLKFDYVNNGTSTNEAEITLLKVEFETFPDDVPGPDKPHLRNMDTKQDEDATYGDYKKFVAYVYEDGNLNLIDYLEGADDPSMRVLFEDNLDWRSKGTDVNGHELNFILEPQDNDIRFFQIEVLPKGGNQVLDRLIITVVPRSTKSGFDVWKSANQDTTWLAELPPLYSTIVAGQDPDENCEASIWEFPADSNSHYHPAADFAMRSEITPGGHGHQACYDRYRSLIWEGVSAGTADKAHPSKKIGEDSHPNQDVLPFIWGLQLDGNPVEGTTLNLNLDIPIAYEGAFIEEYLNLRPPIANSKTELQPGSCP
jgi:hypothetical protein